jgi:hypothetical protein
MARLDALTEDELRDRRSENRGIVGWIMGFWVVAFAGFAIWLEIEHDDFLDLSCPVPGKESSWGKASWQWFPPGQVCSFPGTDIPIQHPSVARGVVAVFLVLVPIVVLSLWIRSEVRIRGRMLA